MKNWKLKNEFTRHFDGDRLVVPLLQGYVDTGEFGFINKMLDSIKVNLYFYGATSLLILVLTVYLILGAQMNTMYPKHSDLLSVTVCVAAKQLWGF